MIIITNFVSRRDAKTKMNLNNLDSYKWTL